jgi:signal transduction histidine kinase
MDTHETKIYTAILIAAGVLGIILVYFIITIIRHQRQNFQLHKEKVQAEIFTLENERKRIVADLHDELGPLLSTVKLHINSLETQIPDDHMLIDRAGEHIDNIILRIREISNNLMPQVLIRKGLIEAIQEFVNNIRVNTGLTIQFTYEDNLTLDKQNDIHIYRMIQEIIHNSIKHADASVIALSIKHLNKKIILMAADNGKGFDYHHITKESSGLGLKNIMSRVEILKGELYIDSGSEKGTYFTIELPNPIFDQ